MLDSGQKPVKLTTSSRTMKNTHSLLNFRPTSLVPTQPITPITRSLITLEQVMETSTKVTDLLTRDPLD